MILFFILSLFFVVVVLSLITGVKAHPVTYKKKKNQTIDFIGSVIGLGVVGAQISSLVTTYQYRLLLSTAL